MYETIQGFEGWEALLSGRSAAGVLRPLQYPDASAQAVRYLRAGAAFRQRFGDSPFAFLSAPGRTELSGNHTDHQHGCVLAASVTMDILAAAAPNSTGHIRIYSEGHGLVELRCDDLSIRPAERNTTAALVRGVLAGLRARGYAVGGFEAYITSEVPQGSGLSSSAAFEVLIGTICNYCFNHHFIPDEIIAQIGKYAENEYFGKPSGLMDQMASAVGGVAYMDFADPANPVIERIPAGFPGYALCIVNAGGSHADLTPEYAAIPGEMRQAAAAFGQETLFGIDSTAFYAKLPVLRGTMPDRALLRAMHFFDENARVRAQADALLTGNLPAYLLLMAASGQSSLALLQNIYPACDIQERSVSLALALAARALQGQGAWRVHGGGFAGTIQALMPSSALPAFIRAMAPVFGEHSCYPISIRPVGGHALSTEAGGTR